MQSGKGRIVYKFHPHLLMATSPRLLVDVTGYPLNCKSEEALQWFDDGVLAYVSFRENALPLLYRALELDDSIVLAHSLLVNILHNILCHYG